MRLKVWLLVAATLVTSIFLSQNAFAARVTQVKGKQILIDLEGESANVGDKFFVMISGKKKGLVTITKLGKSKAIASIDKGKAEVGSTVQLAKSGGGSSSQASDSAQSSGKSKSHGGSKGKSWGVMAGYSMDSQTAKIISPDRLTTLNAAMTGTGTSLIGFADIPYSGSLGFVARGGFETFNVTGNITSAFCTGTTNCTSKITYLTLDALIRYKFGEGKLVPWAGAGIGIYYPISKETTALGDIGMSTLLLVDGGINYNLSATSYIPVVLEYGYFPPSPDVSTHIIAVRVGYGMTW